MKKYRSERNGRRSFATALHYNTADVMAIEKTRTPARRGGPRYALTVSTVFKAIKKSVARATQGYHLHFAARSAYRARCLRCYL